MNLQRLKELETIKLQKGAHESFDKGACIIKLVSYVANEHPQCACPILTEYAIQLNNMFNNKHRRLLKPFILLLLDTKATDAVQMARKRLFRFRHVTVMFPIILDILKVTDISNRLKLFQNNVTSMAEAAVYLQSKRGEIIRVAYTYAYGNAYTYANAYATASNKAYAEADAYTYSYVNIYTYALRQKIAEVAIETLRMAIEVKEK
jgi:hypothetical protein